LLQDKNISPKNIFGLATPVGRRRAGMAKRFDPSAEFATVWPLKGRIQWDLRNLFTNRLLKYIVVQW